MSSQHGPLLKPASQARIKYLKPNTRERDYIDCLTQVSSRYGLTRSTKIYIRVGSGEPTRQGVSTIQLRQHDN